jgi:hypothetical protein
MSTNFFAPGEDEEWKREEKGRRRERGEEGKGREGRGGRRGQTFFNEQILQILQNFFMLLPENFDLPRAEAVDGMRGAPSMVTSISVVVVVV